MAAKTYFKGDRVSEILSIPLQSRTEYESLELLELTYNINFFSKLRQRYSDAFHKKSCSFLTLEKFTKNQYIYQKSDPSIKYYILLKGHVSLLKSQSQIEHESSSSSSSESSSESFSLNTQRNRFKAFDINPEIIYQLSFKQSTEKEQFLISKDILERESKELVEFIFNIEAEEGKEIKTIKSGEDFGYEALFPSKPRNVNAVARSHVEVASLHKIIIKKIIHEIAQERGLEMIGYLQSVSIFSKWHKSELAKVLNLFKHRNFTKGQYAFKEGQKPDFVYFIKEGTFSLRKNCCKSVNEESRFGRILKITKPKKRQLIRLDLVIKGRSEIIGAEEILNNEKSRLFSCICSSASSEVYEVNCFDFQKLIKPETHEMFLEIVETNTQWLKARSETMEITQPGFSTYEAKAQRKVAVKSLPATKPVSRVRSRPRFSINISEVPQASTRRVSHSVKSSRHKEEPINIHLSSFRKNNPRLAPPSFLLKLREKLLRRFEG